MIQTLLRKWAYAISYANSAQRRSAVAPWLRFYNEERPHATLKRQTPLSRLHSSLNNRGRNHTGRDRPRWSIRAPPCRSRGERGAKSVEVARVTAVRSDQDRRVRMGQEIDDAGTQEDASVWQRDTLDHSRFIHVRNVSALVEEHPPNVPKRVTYELATIGAEGVLLDEV